MTPIFPELPTKLGIYTLTQQLGSREHSELYLATQSYVDRAVVIEVLRPDCSPMEMGQFREAARQRAAVSLPHVSPVLESARTGTLNYLIQEEPAGTSLQALEQPLDTAKAFSLIQAMAELYCACAEQGVAAQPLELHSIYMEGDTFSFFSPVVAGEITDEQRAAQMAQLAAVLEHTLPEEDVAMSNISIIIHWLRYGYGNAPLQWRPLAASLNTLRAQKMSANRHMPLLKRLRALGGSKRAMRQALRSGLKYALFGLLLLAVTVGVGCLGLLYEDDVVQELPALADDYVCCGKGANQVFVRSMPVSVEDYEQFLRAWAAMKMNEREALCKGMPAEEARRRDREPLEWREQHTAALGGREWRGFKMSMHAPVRGVSYYDALVYARYVGGELPGVEHVRTARHHAGEPLVEEWTSLCRAARHPYERHYLLYPAYGSDFSEETQPDNREQRRSFRVMFKKKPTQP